MSKTDDAYQIVWLVRRLFRALAHRSTDSLQDLGISAADRAVLEFLYPNEKLSVPEIAERYQVSRQHVQTTVNVLVNGKFVGKEVNPRHRRSPLLSLTARGRTLFKKIKVRDKDTIDYLFSSIPEKDRRVTHRTLEALLEKLR